MFDNLIQLHANSVFAELYNKAAFDPVLHYTEMVTSRRLGILATIGKTLY